MLSLTIPDRPDIEYYDQKQGCFFVKQGCKGARVQLEHSLISVSKWESKWKKSFLNTKQKTIEETIDYVRCMTLGTPPNPDVYNNLTQKELDEIYAYINDTMTATKINDRKNGNRPSRKIITSELIYSWMIDCEIPGDYAKWHLNRLLTLIQVRRLEMSGKDGHPKMRRKDMIAENKALNAARRAKMGSKG